MDAYLRIKHDDGPRFVVTTYCSFVDDRFTARLKRAADAGVEALWIADEMHNLSSHRLRQVMKADAELFRYRLGLSATPDTRARTRYDTGLRCPAGQRLGGLGVGA